MVKRSLSGTLRFCVFASSVAGLAAVALRHPNGFRRFSFWTWVFKCDQVPLSPIGRLKGFGDSRAADAPAQASQLAAQWQRESGEYRNARKPLMI